MITVIHTTDENGTCFFFGKPHGFAENALGFIEESLST